MVIQLQIPMSHSAKAPQTKKVFHEITYTFIPGNQLLAQKRLNRAIQNVFLRRLLNEF